MNMIDRDNPSECLTNFLKNALLHEWFEFRSHRMRWILVQLVGKSLELHYDRWEFHF
jgi:hypothetical protein